MYVTVIFIAHSTLDRHPPPLSSHSGIRDRPSSAVGARVARAGGDLCEPDLLDC